MYISHQEITAIIFDMDGLILDNGAIYKAAYQKAAQHMGYDLRDDLYGQLLGRTHAACEEMLQQTFGPSFSVETFAHHLEAYYQQTLEQDGVQFRDGFEALFSQLQQHHLPIGLATSSPLSQVKHHLGHTPYLETFDVICTIDDVQRGKPNPEIYQLAMERMQVAPQTTVVFEDSNNGMRAAIAAGCLGVMVPNQAPPEEDVERDAFLIRSSLADVMPLMTC